MENPVQRRTGADGRAAATATGDTAVVILAAGIGTPGAGEIGNARAECHGGNHGHINAISGVRRERDGDAEGPGHVSTHGRVNGLGADRAGDGGEVVSGERADANGVGGGGRLLVAGIDLVGERLEQDRRGSGGEGLAFRPVRGIDFIG